VSQVDGPSLGDRFATDANIGPASALDGEMNFAAMTLEQEADGGGWTRTTYPTGGKNAPLRQQVVGMRGEPCVDSDNTFGRDGDVSHVGEPGPGNGDGD
jgi:hypothetical protein